MILKLLMFMWSFCIVCTRDDILCSSDYGKGVKVVLLDLSGAFVILVRCPFPLSVVRCPLSVVRCPLPVAHCPLPVARCPLSVARCPLSVVRCPLSVVRCPLPVARCPLPVVRCPLSVVRCPLPVARCPLPVARCPLSVVRCPLPVARCPLSVVRCPLSVVRCPLSVARCPLSVVCCMLLDQLHRIGERALRWMKSYLGQRTQSVKVRNVSSQNVDTHVGVPQVVCLGHSYLLYNYYCLELGSGIERHQLCCHMYADDIQLDVEFLRDTVTAADRISRCIAYLKAWLVRHNLLLNKNKTKVIVISAVNTSTCSKLPVNTNIYLCSWSTTPILCISDLGVMLDSTMSMAMQISRT